MADVLQYKKWPRELARPRIRPCSEISMAEDDNARGAGAAMEGTAIAREAGGGFAGCLYSEQQAWPEPGNTRGRASLSRWPTEILDDHESQRLVCIAGWPRDGTGPAEQHGEIARRLTTMDLDNAALASLGLRGSYALAIVCRRTSRVLLATDRMGSIPLCFSRTGGNLAFATDLESLASMMVVRDTVQEISSQGIYDYVYFHVIPAPTAIYREVSKLGAGECCRIDRTGVVKGNISTPALALQEGAVFNGEIKMRS